MISIIIPTYKPQEYFRECLESLNNQDLNFSLFNVVVVLNGPKDPYASLISNWLENFQFEVHVIYAEIASVSHARNLALDKINNGVDYVIFLDDDDILSRNFLKELSVLADGRSIIVSNTKNFLKDINNAENDYLTFNESFNSKNIIRYRKYLSNACCKLIPFCLIGNIRFNENLKNSEDAIFMFELSKNLNFLISSDPNVIYYRRLREDSASRKKLSIKNKFYMMINIMFYFSMVYFKSPFRYNFILYITRLMAALKRFLLTLK